MLKKLLRPHSLSRNCSAWKRVRGERREGEKKQLRAHCHVPLPYKEGRRLILVPRAYDLLVSGWIVQQFKKNRWGSGDENGWRLWRR